MTAINGTVIYRELGDPDPALIAWLDARNQLFNVVDDRQKEHLYVDNDVPRDAVITPLIVESTIGFSLFTESGQRISDYSRLDKAIRAQAGASLVVKPEVELEDEIVLPEDHEPEPQSALEAALASRIAELEAQVEEEKTAEAPEESDENEE